MLTLFFRFSLPDSKGGICDILAYAPDVSIRSSWSTIASPRFNIYERDRSCDDLNSLNLESEAPRSRILTGKTQVNIEDPSSLDQTTEFAGVSGNSYYHVQSISTPSLKFSPRPVEIPTIQSLPPLTSSSQKPVYSVAESTNQKIQLGHSSTASLLLGNGKKNFDFTVILFIFQTSDKNSPCNMYIDNLDS